MTTQVINGGSSVRVLIQPRSITNSAVVDGELIIAYTDGTVDNLGAVVAGFVLTVETAHSNNPAQASQVDGFLALAGIVASQIVTLGGPQVVVSPTRTCTATFADLVVALNALPGIDGFVIVGSDIMNVTFANMFTALAGATPLPPPMTYANSASTYANNNSIYANGSAA